MEFKNTSGGPLYPRFTAQPETPSQLEARPLDIPKGMRPTHRHVDGRPVFDPLPGSGQGGSFYIDAKGRRITPTATEKYIYTSKDPSP